VRTYCKECKEVLPADGSKRGRQYCDNGICGRMHAQRASKARRGLISPRRCPAPHLCAGCKGDCAQCHNTHPARPCALARRVRYQGHERLRRVVPIDCKECAHGT
jgi:hypothetical protein